MKYVIVITGASSGVSALAARAPASNDARFCLAAQHRVAGQHFPMSRINEACARLESGKARYGIAVDLDF